MRTDRRKSYTILSVLCMGLLLTTGYARAVESFSVTIERIDGDQWWAEGIETRVRLGVADPVSVTLLIDTLNLPAPVGELHSVRLHCAALEWRNTGYRCARTDARVGASPLDDLPFTADIRYQPQTQTISISSVNVPLMGQRAAVDGQWQRTGWRAEIRADGVEAMLLYEHLAESVTLLPGAEVAAGSVSIVALAVSGEGPAVMTTTLDVDGLVMSNESGTLATDGLAARVQITLETDATSGAYDYRLSLAANRGEAYLEPAYFDLEASPLTLDSTGTFDTDAKTLSVSQLQYQHARNLDARASASFNWGLQPSMDSANLTIDKATFPGAYKTYVQGFLVGTPLAKLQTSGSIQGEFEMVDNRLVAVDLRIDELDADDTEQRLAMFGANGVVHWRRDGLAEISRSRIAWKGGFIDAIGYGASSITLALAGDDISLIGDLRVPVLDGALVIETFMARHLASDRPAMDFDARLEPIGLRRLTTAFGWPAFPGTLSGELPLLSLRDGVMTLGGSLVARIFDGTAKISELRIEKPFSANRRGAANITFDNLDLALITDVFSLGRIAGRLDGRIEGLRTVKSRPVAFDASFYTPDDDVSRRRISRRAINNLSEIAGAGTALLSGGLLKFFEEFGYSSIGINCRLRGDVCEMSGVKPAADGYYIVEGRGLPRIDVIGHSREVNWPRLVAQIEEALRSTDATSDKRSESP